MHGGYTLPALPGEVGQTSALLWPKQTLLARCERFPRASLSPPHLQNEGANAQHFSFTEQGWDKKAAAHRHLRNHRIPVHGSPRQKLLEARIKGTDGMVMEEGFEKGASAFGPIHKPTQPLKRLSLQS